jgi:hypothetical protein
MTLLWWGFLIAVALAVFRIALWIIIMIFVGIGWLISLAFDN